MSFIEFSNNGAASQLDVDHLVNPRSRYPGFEHSEKRMSHSDCSGLTKASGRVSDATILVGKATHASLIEISTPINKNIAHLICRAKNYGIHLKEEEFSRGSIGASATTMRCPRCATAKGWTVRPITKTY